MSDTIATPKRNAVILMIEAGLSLPQVNEFIATTKAVSFDYFSMDDVQAFIKKCGFALGFTQPTHPSWN